MPLTSSALTGELLGDVRHAIEVVHRLAQSGALTPMEEDALVDGVVAGNPALLSLTRFYGQDPEAFLRHTRRNLGALRGPMFMVDAPGSLVVSARCIHAVVVL